MSSFNWDKSETLNIAMAFLELSVYAAEVWAWIWSLERSKHRLNEKMRSKLQPPRWEWGFLGDGVGSTVMRTDTSDGIGIEIVYALNLNINYFEHCGTLNNYKKMWKYFKRLYNSLSWVLFCLLPSDIYWEHVILIKHSVDRPLLYSTLGCIGKQHKRMDNINCLQTLCIKGQTKNIKIWVTGGDIGASWGSHVQMRWSTIATITGNANSM